MALRPAADIGLPRSKGGFRLQNATLLIPAICIFNFATPAYAQEQIVDPNHPACYDAFKKLPISTIGQFPIVVEGGVRKQISTRPAEMENHFKASAEAYNTYDRDCFYKFDCEPGDAPIKCPRPHTKAVIDNVYGTLFDDIDGDKSFPYCSAFRISNDYIVTARHCLKPLMHFRLYADPSRKLTVTLSDAKNIIGAGTGDISDFAVLRIGRSSIVFDKNQAIFSRNSIDKQAINIIAISTPVFTLQKLDPPRWRQAVRFTRLNAARIWSFEEAGKRDAASNLVAECILHRAPTFPGMSGGPILAIKASQSPITPPSISIIGIHLRNGYPASQCGDWADFNIGLRLPAAIIQRANVDAN